MRICSKCKTENDDQYKYCKNCGANLEETKEEKTRVEQKECPNCKAFVEEKHEFCPFCGTKFNEKRECSNCKAALEETYEFCPFCGTKFNEKRECSNCKTVLEKDYEFCPNCGMSYNKSKEQITSYSNQAQKKAKNQKEKVNKLGVFNLISKICIASLTLTMLILFLFTPIYKSKISAEYADELGGREYSSLYVKQTGIQVITNAFRAMSNFDETKLEELIEKRYEKLEEKYGDVQNPTRSEFQKMLDILSPYDFLMIDFSEDGIAYTKTIQAQVIMSAVFILSVSVILILATIFSILAIFKKDYNMSKIMVFYAFVFGLTLLLATAFRLPGNEGVAAAKVGIGTVFVLAFTFLIFVLAYLYNIWNKKTDFSVTKVVSKSIGFVVLFLAIVLANGNLMNTKISNTNTKSYVFHPTIQNQLQSFEIIQDYEDTAEWNYVLEDMLQYQYNATKIKFNKQQITYTNQLTTILVSDSVIYEFAAPELTLLLCAVYYVTQIVLCLAMIFLCKNLYRNGTKGKEFLILIFALVLALATVVLTSVHVSLLNSVKELTNTNVKMTFTVSASMIVTSILTLGCVIYMPILNRKIKAKEEKAEMAIL